ncbi:STAS-like domain-containing protein [Enterococcus casseliflavus]|uniref:STAS-like domain-containing protein n=1 Tax=Enterococcus casseliflavus TaxID=37734 RepID=UPI0035CC610B
MVNKIEVTKDIENHVTNSDGDKLYNIIVHSFDKGVPVEVSFADVYGVNSSFINSAFIQLLDKYEFSFIKSKLKFTHTNKQINSMIQSRFNFETAKLN